jgi:8-oxo-dGTP pyrophosphatase MutT (NUDIX family)
MNVRVAPEELRCWMGEHLDPLEDSPPAWNGVPISAATVAGWLDEPEKAMEHAAVLVGLVERDHGLSVILTRRSDNLRSHTGQVALPGGRRDPGESPVQTALREAQEEIGLDPAFVSAVGLSTPFRTPRHLIVPVVGFVTGDFSLTANPVEVAEIFETPFGYLMDPANYELKERLMPAGDWRRFYATTHENQYIWGVTAGILRTLYDRLYGAALA